jgi:hypothetical protein
MAHGDPLFPVNPTIRTADVPGSGSGVPLFSATPEGPGQVKLSTGLVVPLEDTTRDENVNSFASNLYSAIHTIDRPRIANELGALNVIDGILTGNRANVKNVTKGISEGWKVGGEGYSLVGADYWMSAFDRAKRNPEDYPFMSTVHDSLSNLYQKWVSGNLRTDVKTGLHDSEEVQAALAVTLGIGTDIILDPLTHIAAPFKAAKAGVGAASEKLFKAFPTVEAKATAVKQGAKDLLDGFMQSKVVESTFKLFSDKYGLTSHPEYNRFEDEFHTIQKMNKGTAIRRNKPLQKRIQELASETGASYEDLSRFIFEASEQSNGWDQSFLLQMDVPNLSPEIRTAIATDERVQRIIGQAKFANEKMLRSELAFGARFAPLNSGEKKNLDKLETTLDKAYQNNATTVINPVTKENQTIEAFEEYVNAAQEQYGTTAMLDYMVHASTPEFRDAVIKKHRGKHPGEIAVKQISTSMASQLKRTINKEGLQFVVSQINKAARDGTLPGYEGIKFSKGAFVEDPALAMTIRELRHLNLMNSLEFYNKTIERFGTRLPDLHALVGKYSPGASKRLGAKKSLEELRRLPDNIKQRIKEGEGIDLDDVRPLNNQRMKHVSHGVVFPSEIANRLDAQTTMLLDPDGRNALGVAWDSASNWWKAATTSIFPSFHVRNLASNVFNNTIEGVRPEAYKEAAKFMKIRTMDEEASLFKWKGDMSPEALKELSRKELARKEPVRDYKGQILTKEMVGLPGTGALTYSDVEKYMNRMGVRGKGLFGADIEREFGTELSTAGKYNPLSINNQAFKLGRKIGEATEDYTRVANFLDGMKRGMKANDALDRVRHALFDYESLTKFEKTVMKRIFPFYAWSRKNIPFQAEMMVKHPGKYMAIDHIRQNVESLHEEGNITDDEYLLADWYMENYPVRVNIGENGKPVYWLAGGWIPAFDVWRIAAGGESGPFELAKDLLHPVPKAIYESYIHPELTKKGPGGPKAYDLFTGREYDLDENVEYLGFKVDPRVKQLMKNLRLLNEADKFMQAAKGEDYPTMMPTPSNEPQHTMARATTNFLFGLKGYEYDFNKAYEGFLKKQGFEKAEAKRVLNSTIKKATSPEEIQGAVQDYIDIIQK